jgi:hypothetical protein
VRRRSGGDIKECSKLLEIGVRVGTLKPSRLMKDGLDMK